MTLAGRHQVKTAALGAVVLVLAGAAPAAAACYHDGRYYEAGYQICFDGWVQECTVADYWKAVGQCRRNDPARLDLAGAGVLLERLAAAVDSPHAGVYETRPRPRWRNW